IGKDVTNEREVGSVSGGGVEVDEVQPMEAVVLPAPHHVQRIREPDALLRIRPAHQLHARAVAQIDGWDGDHRDLPLVRASSRNACSQRTPAVELFSGWNWTPTAVPARTAAA